MSAISVLNSFAQSREHDAVLIRDGISYGDVREVVRELSAMRGALDALLEIAEQVVDTRRCSVGVLRAMNEARRHVTPNASLSSGHAQENDETTGGCCPSARSDS